MFMQCKLRVAPCSLTLYFKLNFLARAYANFFYFNKRNYSARDCLTSANILYYRHIYYLQMSWDIQSNEYFVHFRSP